MTSKTFDPLNCIPSAEAVKARLAKVLEEARRLNILLQTAEQIERPAPDATARPTGQEGGQ